MSVYAGSEKRDGGERGTRTLDRAFYPITVSPVATTLLRWKNYSRCHVAARPRGAMMIDTMFFEAHGDE